jgi:hypothetical protein
MNQGCPNEGADGRLWGKLGCKIQAALSVKEGGPKFRRLSWGRLILVLAYPPYLAIGFQWRKHERTIYIPFEYVVPEHRWAFTRLGFRYDQNWPGYIFPCVTLKFNEEEFVDF